MHLSLLARSPYMMLALPVERLVGHSNNHNTSPRLSLSPESNASDNSESSSSVVTKSTMSPASHHQQQQLKRLTPSPPSGGGVGEFSRDRSQSPIDYQLCKTRQKFFNPESRNSGRSSADLRDRTEKQTVKSEIDMDRSVPLIKGEVEDCKYKFPEELPVVSSNRKCGMYACERNNRQEDKTSADHLDDNDNDINVDGDDEEEEDNEDCEKEEPNNSSSHHYHNHNNHGLNYRPSSTGSSISTISSSSSPAIQRTSFPIHHNSHMNSSSSSSSSGSSNPKPSCPNPFLKFSIDDILRPDFGVNKCKLLTKSNVRKLNQTSSPVGLNLSQSAGLISPRARNGSVSSTEGHRPYRPSSVNCHSEDSNGSSKSRTREEVVDETKVNPPVPEGPLLWPAWVYCTRYSDRPSSGPRSRRIRKLPREQPEEKRPRTAFTAEQLSRLKQEFEENRYLTEKRRQDLARDLKLHENQIKIWFQNKRAKLKKSTGTKNGLALQLMAQGLYNHSTVPVDEDDEMDMI